MKKVVIAGCITGSVLIILTQFGFFEAFLMFLLAGAVPGTTYSIPSNIMYGLLLTGISLVIIRLIGLHVLDLLFDTSEKTTKTSAIRHARKKRLPKRRFSQI